MSGSAPGALGDPAPFPLGREGPFDPPAALGELNRRSPVTRVVLRGGDPVWLVTGWDAVRGALAETRLSAAHTRAVNPAAPPAPSTPRTEEPQIPPGLFIAMDRPGHTAYRRAVAPALSTAAMRRIGPYVDRVVTGHVEAMVRGGAPADFVAAVALPVPALVVGELIGVPVGDRDEFCHRSATLLTVNDRGVHDYLRELIRRKRTEPGDDLISHLLSAEVDRAPLPPEELATICAMLLAAGHETVTSMLALGLFVLLHEPDRYRALCREPDGADATVEELLRYLTVVQFGVFRVATEDLVLGGQRIAAGETVVASLAAANRDHRRFDAPDGFDAERDTPQHVAFGHGIHRCIGEHLARRQLVTTLRELTRRLPTLRLAAPAADLPTSPDRAIYGVRELPVTW
ncbi:MAG: cytochrome P450 [Actinocatenispora sp.]